MAAYAALVSLLNNIEQMMDHPHLSGCFDHQLIQPLMEKVRSLIDFMDANNYGAGSTETDYLEREIAAVAHAAEDAIESHIVDQIHAGTAKISLRCSLDLQRKIQDLEAVLDKANEFKWSERSVVQKHTPVVDIGETVMIGLDAELNQLLRELTSGHKSKRRTISIIGMGGTGKTTLAKNIYEDKLIKEHFHCRAWATISQKHNAKEILTQLLSQLERFNSAAVNELGLKLHKNLSGRRYLIILDDIWSVKAWVEVRRFFPDNNVWHSGTNSQLLISQEIKFHYSLEDRARAMIDELQVHSLSDAHMAAVYTRRDAQRAARYEIFQHQTSWTEKMRSAGVQGMSWWQNEENWVRQFMNLSDVYISFQSKMTVGLIKILVLRYHWNDGHILPEHESARKENKLPPIPYPYTIRDAPRIMPPREDPPLASAAQKAVQIKNSAGDQGIQPAGAEVEEKGKGIAAVEDPADQESDPGIPPLKRTGGTSRRSPTPEGHVADLDEDGHEVERTPAGEEDDVFSQRFIQEISSSSQGEATVEQTGDEGGNEKGNTAAQSAEKESEVPAGSQPAEEEQRQEEVPAGSQPAEEQEKETTSAGPETAEENVEIPAGSPPAEEVDPNKLQKLVDEIAEDNLLKESAVEGPLVAKQGGKEMGMNAEGMGESTPDDDLLHEIPFGPQPAQSLSLPEPVSRKEAEEHMDDVFQSADLHSTKQHLLLSADASEAEHTESAVASIAESFANVLQPEPQDTDLMAIVPISEPYTVVVSPALPEPTAADFWNMQQLVLSMSASYSSLSEQVKSQGEGRIDRIDQLGTQISGVREQLKADVKMAVDRIDAVEAELQQLKTNEEAKQNKIEEEMSVVNDRISKLEQSEKKRKRTDAADSAEKDRAAKQQKTDDPAVSTTEEKEPSTEGELLGPAEKEPTEKKTDGDQS